MNREWLLENAGLPICYKLGKKQVDMEDMLTNTEVSSWLARLKERSDTRFMDKIHGSHDYRMENILGKCWILGLNREIPALSENIAYIIEYLNIHVREKSPYEEHSFARLYYHRDYEKIMCCFLPFMGYYEEPSIRSIVSKRIELLYGFTKQKRYDIYTDGSKYKGLNKDWQPFLIKPELYADGHITLPDMHDYILFAGMYDSLTEEEKEKVEVIVQWLFEDGYQDIIPRYGYFYSPTSNYHYKAILLKLNLTDFTHGNPDRKELGSLLFTIYILSYFECARKTKWFKKALDFLEQYKDKDNRYCFPPYMIAEKSDGFVIFGKHMNVGEDPKKKDYKKILSTYWMEAIYDNLCK